MAARPAAASDAPQPALPPGPGRIVIAARPVLPTAAAGSKDMKDRKEPPPQVELSVRDEGTGIAADDLLRIFEPFYTTKGRGRGTGLGLSICRELARTLGGTITVESTPGQGSTFAVRLPIGDPTAAKRPTRESALVGDSV
jgi:signal transduction histidine kinase